MRDLGAKGLGRLLGLPPATTDYTVNRVRIPMRDGVQLVADHYAPTTPSPAGTLLARGPYGRGFPFSLIYSGLYAARGYHVVLQSVRGTFGSGGDFEPMANEAADGADTVAWLREQPWFTGRFATIGASYLGFTQWALLQDPPPELAAAVITAGPHDFGAGTRVRILITGSWSPRYARNLGTGEPALTGREARPAVHTVGYGRSRLLLPVGATDLSADGVADPDGDLG